MKTKIFIFIFLMMTFVTQAQIIHIPSDYSSIQEGINAAADGDTVLVAEGTYFENINFNGKAITVASKFILDGDDVHIAQTVIDGSFPVHPDSASTVNLFGCKDTISVLKGFTITGGKGIKEQHPTAGLVRAGGGISMDGGKIENNIITGNSINTTYYAPGGGIAIRPYDIYANAVIRNNSIFNNSLVSTEMAQGAGIYAGCEKGVTIVENNKIFENSATCSGNYKANAGGIMMATGRPWEATFIVRNNLIAENSVHCIASHGGGIFLTFPSLGDGYKEGKSGIEIYNNIIANNYSEDRGGGIAIWDQLNGAYNIEHPNPLIYNNTIIGNEAIRGAGIFNFEMNALLFNNIFWNNGQSIGNKELSLYDINYIYGPLTNHGKFQSYYNDIKGGWPGAGNIDKDAITDPDDFSLTDISPCIGRGIDSVNIKGNWYYAPAYDLEGANRLMASTDQKIDMGAIESSFNKPLNSYDSETVINIPTEQPTIQAGINAASDGDTVLVDEGYYYENINFKGKAITVASSFILDGDDVHIAQTVIDGSMPAHPDTASVVFIGGGLDSTTVLSGFTITGGKGSK